MVSVKEIVKELSDIMPDFIVERKGRTNQVNVYTSNRKMGISTVFPRKTLRQLDLSICYSVARILTATFDRAQKGVNYAT